MTTATATAVITERPRWSIRHHSIGFWVVAAAFMVNLAFSAVPTPLYVIYQQRDHFSDLMVTIVYAVYAVGVIGSLFLAGHISDWVGRRRVMVPYIVFGGVLLALAVAVAFMPETADLPDPRPAWRPQRVAIPAHARATFYAGTAAGAAAFAVYGVFNSLMPGFLAGTMHETSYAVAGAVAFAAFASGAVAQIALAVGGTGERGARDAADEIADHVAGGQSAAGLGAQPVDLALVGDVGALHPQVEDQDADDHPGDLGAAGLDGEPA